MKPMSLRCLAASEWADITVTSKQHRGHANRQNNCCQNKCPSPRANTNKYYAEFYKMSANKKINNPTHNTNASCDNWPWDKRIIVKPCLESILFLLACSVHHPPQSELNFTDKFYFRLFIRPSYLISKQKPISHFNNCQHVHFPLTAYTEISFNEQETHNLTIFNLHKAFKKKNSQKYSKYTTE